MSFFLHELCRRRMSVNSINCVQIRYIGRPSAVQGHIFPHKGFVSPDITVTNSPCAHGGPYNRCVRAQRDFTFNTEIINVPAFITYFSDTGTPVVDKNSPLSGANQTKLGSSAIFGHEKGFLRRLARIKERLQYLGVKRPPSSTVSEKTALKQMCLGASKLIMERMIAEYTWRLAEGKPIDFASSGGPSGRTYDYDNNSVIRFFQERIMTLCSGGTSYFFREKEVMEFVDTLKVAPPPGNKTIRGMLYSGQSFLDLGIISVSELQKLPQIIEFNRFDLSFRGRKGIVVSPEVSYFNHNCEPNVEVTIQPDRVGRYSANKGGKGVNIEGINNTNYNFVLSVRTVRPVIAGEELFINYLPGPTLPLSRLQTRLSDRWGFECMCSRCKQRMVRIWALVSIIIIPPVLLLLLRRKRRKTNTLKQYGIN